MCFCLSGSLSIFVSAANDVEINRADGWLLNNNHADGCLLLHGESVRGCQCQGSRLRNEEVHVPSVELEMN